MQRGVAQPQDSSTVQSLPITMAAETIWPATCFASVISCAADEVILCKDYLGSTGDEGATRSGLCVTALACTEAEGPSPVCNALRAALS